MTTESTPAKVRLSDQLGHTPLTDACLLDRDDVVVRDTNGGGVHIAAVREMERTLRAALAKARAGLAGGLWDYGPGQDEHDQCQALIAEIDTVLGPNALEITGLPKAIPVN